jgi:hypothetical protein
LIPGALEIETPFPIRHEREWMTRSMDADQSRDDCAAFPSRPVLD